MFIYIIFVLLVIFLIYVFIPKKKLGKSKAHKVYSEIKGYEQNTEIIQAVSDLQLDTQKTAEDYIILGDMLRYNFQQEELAIENYRLGLQQAILNSYNGLAFNINDRIQPDTPLIIPQNNTIIRSDPQNVHDSNVNYQIRERYSKISDTPINPDVVKKFIEKYPKYKNTILNLKNNPCELSALKASDYDVFLTVVNRGEHVWEALGDSLNEISKGICLTGRVSQLLDALTIIDDPQPIISVDILRKEIFDDAGQFMIKNEHLEDGLEEALVNYIKSKYSHLCSPEIFNKIITEVNSAF